MIIKRVLNNNAIMVLDERGEEMIVKGKGIAFHKSSGDEVEESKIEKIFTLDSKETTRKYQDVLVNTPEDCIEVGEEAIALIKSSLDKTLSDKIYVTLTDHIDNLLERIRMGIIFNNSLLWDVKRMYPEEYKAGLKVVELMRKRFDIKISDDEACFVALHIVNAEMDVNFEDTYAITAMIDEIYEMVCEDFHLNIDKESLEYTRFIMHLRFFFERLIKKESIKVEKNKDILGYMQKDYAKQYACVQRIIAYISTKYDEPIEGEVIYLLIHIVKLTT